MGNFLDRPQGFYLYQWLLSSSPSIPSIPQIKCATSLSLGTETSLLPHRLYYRLCSALFPIHAIYFVLIRYSSREHRGAVTCSPNNWSRVVAQQYPYQGNIIFWRETEPDLRREGKNFIIITVARVLLGRFTTVIISKRTSDFDSDGRSLANGDSSHNWREEVPVARNQDMWVPSRILVPGTASFHVYGTYVKKHYFHWKFEV